MVGAVGGDDFGSFLRGALRAAGVDDRRVVTIPEAGSGMSVAIVDQKGDYAATIVSGANQRIDPAVLAQDALWADVGLVVLQNEIPESVNLAACREARRRGIRTVLNAAPARALPAALIPLIDILVVNAVEAEMMGTPVVDSLPAAEAAAQRLADRFAGVIVTAGALGLAGIGPDGTAFRIPARPVPVVSSHGAGDAFIGTLAAALLQGAGLAEAADRAALAAARHVSGQPPS
jgi:ribokinase